MPEWVNSDPNSAARGLTTSDHYSVRRLNSDHPLSPLLRGLYITVKEQPPKPNSHRMRLRSWQTASNRLRRVTICSLLHTDKWRYRHHLGLLTADLDVLWSASVFICLFLCLSTLLSQKSHVHISPNFLHYLWPWLAPPLTVMWDVIHVLPVYGPKHRRRACFIQFARWRHRGEVCSLRLHPVFWEILVNKCDFCIIVFCQVVRKHYTLENNPQLLIVYSLRSMMCACARVHVYTVKSVV